MYTKQEVEVMLFSKIRFIQSSIAGKLLDKYVLCRATIPRI